MGRLSWIVSAKRGIRNQFEFARPGRRSSSARKKLSRGASLRGQGTPADPARLRSERARNSSKTKTAAGWRKSLKAGLRIFCRRKISAALREAGDGPSREKLYLSSSLRRNS